MFQKVPSRNAGFTLPGGLTEVLKNLKKKSLKNIRVLLIIAGLIPFLFTVPVTSQVRTAIQQIAAVPAATQMPTDEATQKRIEELIAQLENKYYNIPGWHPNDIERIIRNLFELYDNGGSFFGLFQEERLVGVVALECKFIGSDNNQL